MIKDYRTQNIKQIKNINNKDRISQSTELRAQSKKHRSQSKDHKAKMTPAIVQKRANGGYNKIIE